MFHTPLSPILILDGPVWNQSIPGGALQHLQHYLKTNRTPTWCGPVTSRKTVKEEKRRNTIIGLFSNELDAARAFNNAAIQHHGEFANLNPIPDDDDNTDSQDNDNPELTTPTSDYEEFTAESGDVEEDVD